MSAPRHFTRRFLLSAGIAATGAGALGGRGVLAATEDFRTWLQGLRRDALAEGVRAQTLDAALRGIAPIDRVLELDRKQPEFTLTFDQYQARVVNDARVLKGRDLLTENAAILAQVSQKFGVPQRFIVALWGIETDYGRITGNFNVVQALATLAYDGRRAAFFRKELINALKIMDREGIAPGQMLGSWAGAMGQSQFMPSSFLSYAVDIDGDGRRDIWTSRPDVFGSIANYLARSGWKGAESWGVRIVPPNGFAPSDADLKVQRSPVEWERLGFVRLDGGVPAHQPEASARLLFPGGPDGPAYLAFNNFDVILRWNRSNYFAVAVGTLADRLAQG